MQLDDIYEPIQSDLGKVEELLKSTSKVDFLPMAEMLAYSLSGDSKRIRPALVLLSGKFYNYDLPNLLLMAAGVELMHTATLVHDDAIDNSRLRRGRLTINTVWDVDKAVLLGDYLFAKAGEFAADTQSVRVIKLFLQALMSISRGELNQAFNAFNLEQTRENYYQRIFNKTASLFVMAAETGAILSKAPENAIDALKGYTRNLGIAFQIVDDILDFVGTEKELGKPVGSDLAEGTITLPAMLLLERQPGDNPLRRLFKGEGDKNKDKPLAIELIRNSPVVQECYAIASDYCNRACIFLESLPDIPARKSLRNLADFITARKR